MVIRRTDPAARDLTHICDYIEGHDGPARARRVALTIYASVNSLAQFPRRGRSDRKSNTRELGFARLQLLAVYRIREEVMKSSAFCIAHKTGLGSEHGLVAGGADIPCCATLAKAGQASVRARGQRGCASHRSAYMKSDICATRAGFSE